MTIMKKPVKDKILADWFDEEFKNNNTKCTYRAALRFFKKNLGIADLGDYLKSAPDVISNLKKFLLSIEGKPSKTINTYVGAVKVFFRDHDIEVPEKEWRKLRKRGFIPKRVKAETQDKKPSKSELKRILNHLNIKGRSLVLFLVSSGARIGETLQLKVEDFNLDAEPPRVHIKASYTKGGMGERTTYLSYEARDTLKDWISIKDDTSKRPGLKNPGKTGKRKKDEIGTKGTFKDDRMFPWSPYTAQYMWNHACVKAGLGMRDSRTKRRTDHILHIYRSGWLGEFVGKA